MCVPLPQNGVCDIFYILYFGILDLIHRSVFSLNVWGEGCLFTLLAKEDISSYSFDVGIHSTLKFGDDVTTLQSNACGREGIFLVPCVKKQGVWWCHSTANWCHSLVCLVGIVHRLEQPRVGKGFRGRMCAAGCIQPCFGKADSEESPCITWPAGLAVCPVNLLQQSDFCWVWCLVTLFPTEDKSCPRSCRLGKSKSGGWQGRAHHLTW